MNIRYFQEHKTNNYCRIKLWRLWKNLKKLKKTEGSQEIPWKVWKGLEWQMFKYEGFLYDVYCQTPLQLENPNSTSVGWSRSWLCFPTGRKEEGRKEGRKEGRNNPHLAFSRRNDPTCLIFSDCLVGVWRVHVNCLESVWRVSGRCPLAVCRVP